MLSGLGLRRQRRRASAAVPRGRGRHRPRAFRSPERGEDEKSHQPGEHHLQNVPRPGSRRLPRGQHGVDPQDWARQEDILMGVFVSSAGVIFTLFFFLFPFLSRSLFLGFFLYLLHSIPLLFFLS